MQRLLVLNLSMSLMWPIINNDFTLESLLFGFIIGFVVLSFVQRKYGLYAIQAARFGGFVLYAILKSNIRLAGQVISGAFKVQTTLRPAIVAVPLELTNPFDITMLATVITLTPGTLSVDLGEDVLGRLQPMSGPDDPTSFGDHAHNDLEASHTGRAASGVALSGDPPEPNHTALLVHVIDLPDPLAFRREIKEQFERPLLQLRSLIREMDAADS